MKRSYNIIHKPIKIFGFLTVHLSFVLTFVHWSYAQTCPDWIKERENMPLCPSARDASILPEIMPYFGTYLNLSFENR